MKKPTSTHVTQFCLFAFPCYWTLAVLFITVGIWKTKISNSDVIAVALVSVAIIVAAILLVKKYYWISLPMISLSIYIALQDDQHVGYILHFFGVYLLLHYLGCGIYTFMSRKKGNE